MAKLNVVVPADEVTIRTESGEAVTYRKVDRPAREGDILRWEDDVTFLTKGGYYEVTSVDFDGDPIIVDDDGDTFNLAGISYELFEKVTVAEVNRVDSTAPTSDIITLDGTQYRKVKRPAAVGERILIVGLENGSGDGNFYRIGNTAVVKSVDDVDVLADLNGNGYVYGDGKWYVGHDDYVVLEPVSENPAEPTKSTEPTSPVRIPVGTYVRVTDEERIYESIAGGTIGKIVEDDGSNIPYKVLSLDGKKSGWYETDELTVLSEADVKAVLEEQAEAERKRIEAEELRLKWAAIGREVNEIKVGDIVEVVDACGGKNPEGRIGVAKNSGTTGSVCVLTAENPTGNSCWAEVKLITPVEQRFDRDSRFDRQSEVLH